MKTGFITRYQSQYPHERLRFNLTLYVLDSSLEGQMKSTKVFSSFAAEHVSHHDLQTKE